MEHIKTNGTRVNNRGYFAYTVLGISRLFLFHFFFFFEFNSFLFNYCFISNFTWR